ncbi:MAG: SPASM domain-containing protein, partial [Patescibacteria group bacterium]
KKLEFLRKQETIKKRYVPCTEVYQKLSVDWDGKITACCADYDNYLTLGDIKIDSLYDIWNKSEKLKAIRNLLDQGGHKCLSLCSKCFHFYDEF